MKKWIKAIISITLLLLVFISFFCRIVNYKQLKRERQETVRQRTESILQTREDAVEWQEVVEKYPTIILEAMGEQE